MITGVQYVIMMDNVNTFHFWRAISKSRRSANRVLSSQPRIYRLAFKSEDRDRIPGDVHLGRVVERRKARQSVLLKAWQAHPERFVRGTPRPPELETITYINRSEEGEAA